MKNLENSEIIPQKMIYDSFKLETVKKILTQKQIYILLYVLIDNWSFEQIAKKFGMHPFGAKSQITKAKTIFFDFLNTLPSVVEERDFLKKESLMLSVKTNYINKLRESNYVGYLPTEHQFLVLATPISDLNLPKNVKNKLLRKKDIKVLGDILTYSKKEIRQISGIGKKYFSEIEQILKDDNFFW